MHAIPAPVRGRGAWPCAHTLTGHIGSPATTSTRRNRSAHVQHQRQRAGRRLGSSGVLQLTAQHSVVRNPGAQQQRQRVDSAPLDAGVPQLIGHHRIGRDPGAARPPLPACTHLLAPAGRPAPGRCRCDERRADIHQTFLFLSCSLICWRNVERFC